MWLNDDNLCQANRDLSNYLRNRADITLIVSDWELGGRTSVIRHGVLRHLKCRRKDPGAGLGPCSNRVLKLNCPNSNGGAHCCQLGHIWSARLERIRRLLRMGCSRTHLVSLVHGRRKSLRGDMPAPEVCSDPAVASCRAGSGPSTAGVASRRCCGIRTSEGFT